MTDLYKYMSRKCLLDLLENSRLRVGTLYEYRDTNEHRREVADQREGRRRIVVDVAGARRRGDEMERAVETIENHRLDEHDDTEVSVVARRGESIVLEASSPNLYLFSASRRCDRELLRTLRYDACVRIGDPDRFFAALTRELRARFLGYRDVIYEEPHRPREREAGVHPAFFKRAEFSHQAEVRALWEPDDAGDIEPLLLVCEEAARLCEPSLVPEESDDEREAHAPPCHAETDRG